MDLFIVILIRRLKGGLRNRAIVFVLQPAFLRLSNFLAKMGELFLYDCPPHYRHFWTRRKKKKIVQHASARQIDGIRRQHNLPFSEEKKEKKLVLAGCAVYGFHRFV